MISVDLNAIESKCSVMECQSITPSSLEFIDEQIIMEKCVPKVCYFSTYSSLFEVLLY